MAGLRANGYLGVLNRPGGRRFRQARKAGGARQTSRQRERQSGESPTYRLRAQKSRRSPPPAPACPAQAPRQEAQLVASSLAAFFALRAAAGLSPTSDSASRPASTDRLCARASFHPAS